MLTFNIKSLTFTGNSLSQIIIMKRFFIFILFILFISCNNTQPPQVESRLEGPDSSQTKITQNQNTITKSSVTNALKETQSTLKINRSIVGVYLGTSDDKAFKLCIDKVYGDNAEGYVVIGNDKKPVIGKVMKLGTEPSKSGDLTLYRLILSETKNTKSGEFVITLSLSPKINSGEGNWTSKNKKQQSNIIIKERAI